MTLSVGGDDDSSMMCEDLNSTDQRETALLLSSLGKKYYKMSGMGQQLHIDKLRELRDRKYPSREDLAISTTSSKQVDGKRKDISRNEFYGRSPAGSRYCALELRLSRSDAAKHFPFEDKVPILLAMIRRSLMSAVIFESTTVDSSISLHHK